MYSYNNRTLADHMVEEGLLCQFEYSTSEIEVFNRDGSYVNLDALEEGYAFMEFESTDGHLFVEALKYHTVARSVHQPLIIGFNGRSYYYGKEFLRVARLLANSILDFNLVFTRLLLSGEHLVPSTVFFGMAGDFPCPELFEEIDHGIKFLRYIGENTIEIYHQWVSVMKSNEPWPMDLMRACKGSQPSRYPDAMVYEKMLLGVGVQLDLRFNVARFESLTVDIDPDRISERRYVIDLMFPGLVDAVNLDYTPAQICDAFENCGHTKIDRFKMGIRALYPSASEWIIDLALSVPSMKFPEFPGFTHLCGDDKDTTQFRFMNSYYSRISEFGDILPHRRGPESKYKFIKSSISNGVFSGYNSQVVVITTVAESEHKIFDPKYRDEFDKITRPGVICANLISGEIIRDYATAYSAARRDCGLKEIIMRTDLFRSMFPVEYDSIVKSGTELNLTLTRKRSFYFKKQEIDTELASYLENLIQQRKTETKRMESKIASAVVDGVRNLATNSKFERLNKYRSQLSGLKEVRREVLELIENEVSPGNFGDYNKRFLTMSIPVLMELFFVTENYKVISRYLKSTGQSLDDFVSSRFRHLDRHIENVVSPHKICGEESGSIQHICIDYQNLEKLIDDANYLMLSLGDFPYDSSEIIEKWRFKLVRVASKIREIDLQSKNAQSKMN